MEKATITSLRAIEILDSRGNPSLAVTVKTECGATGTAMVPSGASTGKYEAYEKRDGDKERYGGKGRLLECKAVEGEIADALLGMPADRQTAIDTLLCSLDGTPNKSRLGAGAILGVSMAVARAAAASKGVELWQYLSAEGEKRLPVPMMNILNGGAHADNPLDVQEFMIVPSGAHSFREGVRMGAEIYHALKAELRSKGLETGVGDEGGFAPSVSSTEEAIELILSAAKRAGYSERKFRISLDVAASEWVTSGGYRLPKRGNTVSREELCATMEVLCKKYPIFSIEDPLGEDDFEGFRKLTASLGDKHLIVGDDLFVTNTERLEEGIASLAANAILIKPNQIGTVSETVRVIELAKKNGYAFILSHRSGETEDTFIADFAVAMGAPLIKTGAPCRSERVAKYNRLLAIEDFLGKDARYGI